MSSDIHLTFPSTLRDDEIDLLYVRYSKQNPDELSRWLIIERNYEAEGDDPLAEIQKHVIEFLMGNTKWDNLAALSFAWLEIRKKVIASLSIH